MLYPIICTHNLFLYGQIVWKFCTLGGSITAVLWKISKRFNDISCDFSFGWISDGYRVLQQPPYVNTEHNSSSQLKYPWKWEGHRGDDFFSTGGTGGLACHADNLWHSHWWQNRGHEMSISVYLCSVFRWHVSVWYPDWPHICRLGYQYRW